MRQPIGARGIEIESMSCDFSARIKTIFFFFFLVKVFADLNVLTKWIRFDTLREINYHYLVRL